MRKSQSARTFAEAQRSPEPEGTTTRSDVPKKVGRILELIKGEGQSRKRSGKSWKREAELVSLFEDLQKQYQYLSVQQEQQKPEDGRSEFQLNKNLLPPSPSGSDDSQYFSSDEIDDAKTPKSEFNKEEVINLKNLLESTRKERDDLSSQHAEALRKIEELETQLKDLRTKADESKKEVSSLLDKNRSLESEASVWTKELEDELTGAKAELKTLQQNKRRLDGQLEIRVAKAKELGEQNKRLQSRVWELESMLKHKGKEFSAVLKNLQDSEKNGSCKVMDLTTQVHELKLELDSVRDQKRELEEKMQTMRNEQLAREKEFGKKTKSLNEELVTREKEFGEKMDALQGVLQKELKALQIEMKALISELEGKKNEISENLIEIECLKEELERKHDEEQTASEERKFLAQQVDELKQKVNSLSEHRHELEEKLQDKSDENDRMMEEKEKLEAKVTESERNLAEKTNEVASLLDKLEAEGYANSTLITGMKIEIESSKQELDSFEAQKSRLELNNKREEDEASRRISLLENENAQLTTMIQDLQRKLTEPGGALGRLVNKNSNIKVRNSPRSTIVDLSSIERKIEDLAVEYRMNLEDNIRILCRRILVLEQLHIETKDSYKAMKERLHDNKGFEDKTLFYKKEMINVMEASMNTNNTINELDLLVKKQDETSRNIMSRVSKASKEIQLMKDWFSQAKLQPSTKSAQEDTRKWDLANKEDVEKLEKKVSDLEGLVRERDIGLEVLGEEKREAIRQLCILIDYHRERCDHFKEIISKATVKRKN